MKQSDEKVGALSFEEAVGELETVVDKLEGGSVPLDEALQLFKRGVALADHCNTKLTNAQGVVKLLYKERSGELQEIPFDVEDEEKL